MDKQTILEHLKELSNKEVEELFLNLHELRDELNNMTRSTFNRTNPFVENLFDWKQKGKDLFNQETVSVYDTSTVVGDVEVGEQTFIGPYSTLDGTGGLKIGSYCSISAGVKIYTHDTVKWALSGGREKYEYSSVSIGDNCFIGAGSHILRGVSIGNCCLVGAGSVVTKDIPDNSIAVGVPAKIRGSVTVDENGKVSLIIS